MAREDTSPDTHAPRLSDVKSQVPCVRASPVVCLGGAADG